MHGYFNRPTPSDLRAGALRRFAVAITVLNVAGHTVLGFEQSWLHPVVALLVAYGSELTLETVRSRIRGVRPGYSGDCGAWIDFLLPAHIGALAVAMLLFPGRSLAPTAFAAAVAIGSKFLLTVEIKGRRRHFLNPSNLGIATTLLLFPWVGSAPPYQWTEGLVGWSDWALPGLIIVTGSYLNARFTGKIPLILAWVGGFVAQAMIRAVLTGTPIVAGLVPMTGVAFVLFTFYMLSDPGTTPRSRRGQVLFGVLVAGTYGLLMAAHLVFGLFFSLVIVCAGRGAWIVAEGLRRPTGGEITPLSSCTSPVTERRARVPGASA